MTISLGTGVSTLAIINFFVAISDGAIDDTERRMMGIVYVVLHIAMVCILLTTLILVGAQLAEGSIGTFVYAQLSVLAVLFVNAILMTVHLMPSTYGPALQTGSWYTFGTLAALVPLGLTDFTYLQFFLGYITWLVLAISIVNGAMAIMKAKRRKTA